MVMQFLGKIFGTKNSREIRRLKKICDRINALEDDFSARSDEELRLLKTKFAERLQQGESLSALLPEAFAAVREAGKRALDMRIFDVQMIGALALHEGKISELRTGEGKTLVATVAV